MRDGVAGVALAFLDHGLPRPIFLRAAERRVDCAGHSLRRAPDERQISPFQTALPAMVGEGVSKIAVGLVVFCDDHDAGCVLVEAVDNARPFDPANAGEGVAAMMDERVDQRAGPIAIAGMHDKSGRLVDDDHVLVFKQDVERDVLASGSAGSGSGKASAILSPPFSFSFASRTCWLLMVTAPASINLLIRLRDKSGPSSPASH